MRLFLVFLIVPLIEIALFVQIGGAIGVFATLKIVIITAFRHCFGPGQGASSQAASELI